MKIIEYHAHIYFEPEQAELAGELAAKICSEFDLSHGRLNTKPVGPHPTGSCLIIFQPALFADLVQWLMFNRNGLTIMVHPDTGHDLEDHSDHVIWLGDSMPVKLDIFR